MSKKNGIMNIRLPVDILNELKRRAKEANVSLNSYMNTYLVPKIRDEYDEEYYKGKCLGCMCEGCSTCGGDC